MNWISLNTMYDILNIKKKTFAELHTYLRPIVSKE